MTLPNAISRLNRLRPAGVNAHVAGALVGFAFSFAALASPAPLATAPVLLLLGLALAAGLSRRTRVARARRPAPGETGLTCAPRSCESPNSPSIGAPEVVVKDTLTLKGRGVYAARRFERGALIEIAPVTVFSSARGVPNELAMLQFNWPVVADAPALKAIAHGYGSLYNHANPANASFELDVMRYEIRFRALRDIEEGEEVTVNYNNGTTGVDSEQQRGEGWFHDHGVKLEQGEIRVRP